MLGYYHNPLRLRYACLFVYLHEIILTHYQSVANFFILNHCNTDYYSDI